MNHRIRCPLASISFVLAMAFSAGAAAQTPPYEQFRISDRQVDAMLSAAHVRCQERSGGVTIHMRNCTAAEQDRLDARVDAAYRDALARLASGAARTRLRRLQREWLATRWDACWRDPENQEGTAGLLNLDGCGLTEMVRRLAYLQLYARRR